MTLGSMEVSMRKKKNGLVSTYLPLVFLRCSSYRSHSLRILPPGYKDRATLLGLASSHRANPFHMELDFECRQPAFPHHPGCDSRVRMKL